MNYPAASCGVSERQETKQASGNLSGEIKISNEKY